MTTVTLFSKGQLLVPSKVEPQDRLRHRARVERAMSVAEREHAIAAAVGRGDAGRQRAREVLIGDEPRQTTIAEQAFLAAVDSGGVYLPDGLLAEVVWVLRGQDLDWATLHNLPERLVRSRGVVVDDIDAVIDALERFRLGGDLADQLILERASRDGALPVLSFDRGFSAQEGVELLEGA
jgi:predicted nucleic-acid-binding protein